MRGGGGTVRVVIQNRGVTKSPLAYLMIKDISDFTNYLLYLLNHIHI